MGSIGRGAELERERETRERERNTQRSGSETGVEVIRASRFWAVKDAVA